MKIVFYISRANVEFDASDLALLSYAASRKNRMAQVTGYLSFSDNHFVQYLEGPDAMVDQIMESIVNDERHSIIYQTSSQSTYRRFPTWNMRLMSDDITNMYDLSNLIKPLIRDSIEDKSKCEKRIWKQVNDIAQLHFES